MGTIRRQLLLNALKVSDVVLMMLSFGAATIAVSRSGPASLTEFLSMRISIGNLVIFCVLLFAWHLIFFSFGMYTSHRMSRRRDEIIDSIKATTTGTAVIVIAAVLFHIRMVRPIFVVVFWLGSTLSTAMGRLVLRFILVKIRQRGRNLRDMVIVGTNLRAVQFAKKIEATPGLGYRVIGFVDDDWAGLGQFQRSGYPLACSFATIPSFLRENVVDEVVMALPMRSLHSRASQIAALCEQQGITLRSLPNMFDLKLARSRVEDFEGDSVVTHYTGSLEGWPVLIKRVLDFTVSLFLILLFLPIFVIAAVLIKLTSRGPVLFVQKRLGLNKRRFSIYKFRTMVPDAEKKMIEIQHLNEVSGPVFKITNDPRVTPIGRFLRKTSIDELPQLFNVLKGEMSLVGPRPLPVRDYEGFSRDWQRRRFSVRPGITCLWQVGGRSSVAFEKWMELDLQYIDKWSLWLDFQILLRTIPAVLRGSGAA